jgi:hypothetical protein
MYRKFIVIVIVATILMLITTPAGAITFGQPDGDRHPNVGLILADLNGDGTLSLRCSGTLIAPTVFLTAGHCMGLFPRLGVARMWITFDTEFAPQTSRLVPVAGFATHPDYNPLLLRNDVGVVILAETITDVTPAMLPTENLLDQMKSSGALQDQMFVNVGYGATADFKGNPPTLSRDGVRRFSTSPYMSLTPNNLGLLANNDATGEGGDCFGDSGGPHFLGDGNVIVSVTSWGDAVCRSLAMSQRLDISSVQEFLGTYVTLP